jgi:L-ascorbate metabolism protein UlaG (beta-lactamase superfamily)
MEGAGILIDPSSDRKKLKGLRKESEVKAVWLSHWHEDHFMQKHLEILVANSTAAIKDGKYCRIKFGVRI